MTVYRLSGDDDAAIRLIEGAVAQQPDSEGLNKELHFCYLNSGKLPDMQKLSMKLFKTQGSPEYAAWAAITAHLSANSALADSAGSLPLHAALPMKAAMPLKVGGMMLTKGYPDLQQAPAAVLQLQVHTLRRQGDLQGAIDLLLARQQTERARNFTPPATPEGGAAVSTPSEAAPADSDSEEEDILAQEEQQAGMVLQPVDALRELVELYCAAEQWAHAWRTYVALLLVCDGDDWAYLTGLIEAVCMAVEGGSASTGVGAMAKAVALCPAPPNEPSAAKCDSLCSAVCTALAQEQPSIQGTYCLLQALQGRGKRPLRGALLSDAYLRLRLAEAASAHSNAEAASALEALPAVPTTATSAFVGAAVGAGLYASATAAVIRYLAAYGHKACAVPDLHPLLAPWGMPAALGVTAESAPAAVAGAGAGGATEFRTPWSSHPPMAEDWQRGDGHTKSSPVATPFSPLRRYAKAVRTGNGYHGWASKPAAAAAGEAAFALGFQGHFTAGSAGPEQRVALIAALQQAATALLPSAELEAEVKAAVGVMPSTKGDKGGHADEVEAVSPEVAAANGVVSAAVDHIQSFVSVAHLSLVLDCTPAVLLSTADAGLGADSASLVASADKLAAAWEFATSTHKAKAAQRGVLPGDELPLLAGELLVKGAAAAIKAGAPSSHSMALLQQAVVLCEYALATSTHNFQLKLQGMRLYALLGNPVGHYLTFQELDMKQVQYDSLQYLALPTMTAFCQLEAACNVALRTCGMHKDVAVEVKGNTKTAYAKLNTAPALDFDVFGRRMQHSLGLAAAQAVNGLMAAPVRSPVEAEQWLKGVVMGGEWRDGVMEQDTKTAMEQLVDNSDMDVTPPISIDQPETLVGAARWNRRQRVFDARLLAGAQAVLLWALQHNSLSTKDKVAELGTLAGEWATHASGGGVEAGAAPVTAAFGGSGQPGCAWDVCAAALTHPGAAFGQSVWSLVQRVGEASAEIADASKLGKKADWAAAAAALSAAEATLANIVAGIEEQPLTSNAEDLASISPRFVSRVAMLVGVGFQVVPVLTADMCKLVPFTKKSKKGKAAPSSSPSLKAIQAALKSFVAALLATVKSVSKSLQYDEKTPKASTLPEGVAVLGVIAVDTEDGEDTTARKCFRLVARNVADSLQGVKAVLQDRSAVLRGLKI